MRKRAYLALTAAALMGMGLGSSASAPPNSDLVSVYRWQEEGDHFGGFSGIEVAADGLGFAALSDRGRYLTGRFQRDASGAIIGVTTSDLQILHGKGQSPLGASRNDSEALRFGPDGSAYISFEGAARVLHYARLDGPAENLPTPKEFRAFHPNKALEAMAIDSAGTIYTMPEQAERLGGAFPVWRFRDGAWSVAFSLPPDQSFLPVDADFGPDGRLYILERQFRGLFGFASRVRALTLKDDRIIADDQVFTTPVGAYDNLEGLSVWRDAAGQIRLTMVSDDNFSYLQQTQIVEFRLPDRHKG